jgi:hypothetical protein
LSQLVVPVVGCPEPVLVTLIRFRCKNGSEKVRFSHQKTR